MKNQKSFSRRQFLTAGTVLGAAAAVGGLSACSSPAKETPVAATGNSGTAASSASAGLPGFLDQADIANSVVVVEPITDFVDEKTYDVVVVGAGVAGVPAVMTALEEGVSVCCLQKEKDAQGNGQGSTGIILEASDDEGILEWMQMIREKNNFRINYKLFKFFADHSGETACKVDTWADLVDYKANTNTTAHSITNADGTHCAMASHGFMYNTELMQRLAAYAEGQGADFYYQTPGVQLIKDESGAVTGVVGKTSDGYVKFNANKAVIMATGDYQNNDTMVEKYCPDAARFGRFQMGRTGDGHIMCMLAGCRMVPTGHAKQIHDPFAAGNGFAAIPLLALDMSGNRFMNEELAMPQWNESLRKLDQENPGQFVRLFDSAYASKYANAPAQEKIEVFIPGMAPEGYTAEAYESSLIDLHRCDTLDELAKELDVPADALKASVERYNKMCDAGADTDFGVRPDNLKKIDTPPYYGIRQNMRIIAINAGVIVDENYQALDENDKPIPGLFVVGTTGGDLCGNVDWSMGSGVSNGHVMTSGRYATLYAIKGNYTPSKPATWDDVKERYTDPGNDTAWSWQRTD